MNYYNIAQFERIDKLTNHYRDVSLSPIGWVCVWHERLKIGITFYAYNLGWLKFYGGIEKLCFSFTYHLNQGRAGDANYTYY